MSHQIEGQSCATSQPTRPDALLRLSLDHERGGVLRTASTAGSSHELPATPAAAAAATTEPDGPVMYQRSMAQTPLAMMGMNPMMSMMMNGYGMGGVMPGMNLMAVGWMQWRGWEVWGAWLAMGGMGGMGGAMRLGVGPVGNPWNAQSRGDGGGAQQFAGAAREWDGGACGLRIMAAGFNGMMSSGNVGPARATTRGQHSFHPIHDSICTI